ncbi:hypothetical protein LEO80_16340 [Aeromonas caviae]|nr:hypothetical protein [Aeromonas caviae]MDX7692311.1 hypothetical protein [Aeromonas caviae]MDX7719223.1 hypothetical protein [Aeromonas caviae]UDN26117.1 hypothetical protein LEO80_16340 [Aeromonas caviae]
MSENESIWLVPEDKIATEIYKAAKKIYKMLRDVDEPQKRNTSFKRLSSLLCDCPLEDILLLSKDEVGILVKANFRNAKAKFSDIESGRFFLINKDSLSAPFGNFIKLTFVQLWVDKKFLAPLNMTCANKADLVFDEICIKSGIETLINVRRVNDKSGIEYHGRMSLEDRNRKANHWARLLLSTTFYSHEDLNIEDCRVLFENGIGKGAKDKLLLRYYVIDFMLTLANENKEAISIVEALVDERNAEKEADKEGARVRKKERDANRPYSNANKTNITETMEAKAVSVSNGEDNAPLEELVSDVITPIRLKKIFMPEEGFGENGFYKGIDDKVVSFSQIIFSTFNSFIRSKKLQRDNNDTFSLCLLLAYVSVYLPSFYRKRDGDLSDYPKTLNDFPCALFFTRNVTFSDDVLALEKTPPLTFLSFIDMYREVNDWTSETIYSRILIVENYFEYLASNKHYLPNADKVENTFSPMCYPRLQKRYGTIKKTVPRKYYATFLSVLYTLEYMVEHINQMATGVQSGILNGKLYQTTELELREHHVWSSIWGKQGNNDNKVLDLSLLNYTPIYYHEGKVKPLLFCPRFYKISNYEIAGNKCQRISPNEIRITILMSETGIRQQHLVWLDQDKYDIAIDRYYQGVLAPLFISTDKSHGEWTAIVSRHIFSILDRQREWNESISLPEYKRLDWYGFTPDSKFGKFRPLFRMPDAESMTGRKRKYDSWKNYEAFPLLLLTLQYIIKEQLGDQVGDDLVFIKIDKNTTEFIDDYTDSGLGYSKKKISSEMTPHGLRAGFVSEAIRFLPPSIIGQFMTGQTEQLVMYYHLFDPEDMPSHQQLLANFLDQNMDKVANGQAPELAEAVLKMNARLMQDIQEDPEKAIQTHGLMSLTGVQEGRNGLDTLRAKQYTELAYNAGHICPFNNTCPKEVVEKLGIGKPCVLCPFAIRGVDHLPAINAQKDKAKEMMSGVLKQINEYKKLNPKSRRKQDLETLNDEYDKFARETYALEAIEQQLFHMGQSEHRHSFFLQDDEGLRQHLAKIPLTEGEHLLKRLVDVQNFPELTSPELDSKFALMRATMLIQEGRYEDILKIGGGTPASQLTAQVASMVSSGSLDMQELFKVSHVVNQPVQLAAPEKTITNRIEMKK